MSPWWLSRSLFISYNINVFILLDGLKIVIPMIDKNLALEIIISSSSCWINQKSHLDNRTSLTSAADFEGLLWGVYNSQLLQ